MKKQAAKSDVRIEYVDLDEVQRWPRNPKQHAEKPLTESVERFGFIEPLIMDEKTGRIVAGHGRLDVLQKMRAVHSDVPAGVQVEGGKWKVPVIRGIKFANEREAEAYLLATNRLVESGGWDDAALLAMLADIQKDTSNLAGVGWDAVDLSTMLSMVQLQDLKVAPLEIGQQAAGTDPRTEKYWVWADCKDEDEMNAILARYGDGSKGRKIDVGKLLGATESEVT